MHPRKYLPILFICLMATPMAGAQTQALVKAENLTMRKEPSKKASSVAELKEYQPVQVLERKDDWAKIKVLPKGETGWVLGTYLSKNAFVHVASDQVNVRSGWGTENSVIMYYYKNYPLRVLAVASNGWIMTLDCDKERGWLNPDLVALTPSFVVTREESCKLRKGPGVENEMISEAEKNVLLEVLEEKDGWLRVKHEGGAEGWISAKTVFGWLDVNYEGDGSQDEEKKDSAGSKGATKKTAAKDDDDGEKKSPAKKSSSSDKGSTNKSSSAKSGTSKTGKKKTSSADDEPEVKKSKSTSAKSSSSSAKSTPAKSGGSKSSTSKTTSSGSKANGTGSKTSSATKKKIS